MICGRLWKQSPNRSVEVGPVRLFISWNKQLSSTRRSVIVIENILSSLQKVKKSGGNKWMACCPSHDDSDPSLAIRLEDDGRILLHCFAGCTALDIVHSVGLELKDLMPEIDKENFHPFAFARAEIARRKRREEEVSHEKLVIKIAESDRKKGKKLSREDLRREAEAFVSLQERGADEVSNQELG